MSAIQSPVGFCLDDVYAAAKKILQAKPDPIPAYRLLNEVLRLPEDDIELCRARELAWQSRWVRQLEQAQLPDGSWGRFHSQDTKVSSIFRTSEEAIDRALSLGLSPGHPVLIRAADYIEAVLAGQAEITDRVEKSEAWPLLIRFILAGRLATLQGRWPQIRPDSPQLDESWEYLAEVARQAFASGQYCLEDEAQAYFRQSNVHVAQGFLESQHALYILSSRPLPAGLELALVEWLWKKPDGIRYLRAPLSDLQPRLIAYWLRSLNILTRFPSWRQVSVNLLNSVWDQRDEQGFWDFSRQIAQCSDFPLSEDWRSGSKRKVDYSTCILVLLRRYFD